MAAQPSIYTRLAESHTHPTGEDHRALHRLPGLLKSGITPITPPPYENYYKHKAHQNLKWYQSQRFSGMSLFLFLCHLSTLEFPRVNRTDINRLVD